jgi:branched-chain amino acid transport system permease protein
MAAHNETGFDFYGFRKNQTRSRFLSGRKPAIVVVLAIVFLFGPLVLSTYWVGLLTQVFVLAILAMSLDLLLGYTGLPSLGHAAFFGVAAYGVAVLSTSYQAGFWTTLAGGLLIGTLLSAILGLVVSHVRDVYFLMITLAIGMVLWGLSYRWIPVTGGDNGIAGVPSLGAHAGLPIAGPTAFYYVALIVFGACAAALTLIVRSPFGLTLRGIRENEGRMRSLGFNTWLHCYLSFVLAGAFASVSGVLWAYYNGFVSPTYLDLTSSSELFLMVTLGGPATLVGPVLGAGVIVLMKNALSAYTARWLLVLGVVYVVSILAAPRGLWNLGRTGSTGQ